MSLSRTAPQDRVDFGAYEYPIAGCHDIVPDEEYHVVVPKLFK